MISKEEVHPRFVTIANMIKVLIHLICFLTHEAFSHVISCSEEDNADNICLNGNYQNLPIELDTILYLKEFVKIDEEEDSITIQMILYNTWMDSRLAPTNKTKL